MARIPWTDEEELILKRMADAGHDPQSVCKVLKSRTKAAVILKAERLQVAWVYANRKPDIDHELLKTIGLGGHDEI